MKCPSIPRFGAGLVAACFLASTTLLHADTEIIDGFNASIHEIAGPDDLHLDPDNVIVAIAVFGDEDREVNGVLFQADKDGGGVVENGDVTVTTTAANSIDGWALLPTFTGGDGDSADNLALIMQDIRWEAAPNPLTVEVEGLDPGALYEIQLLVNEGADRDRHWDIGVGDLDEPELVIDDFTSEGDSLEGVWSAENSFSAKFEAAAGADGKLNVIMQQHIGGQDQAGSDNNPILQAFILHKAGSAGVEVVHGKQEILDEGGPDGWDLTVFVVNPLLTSEDTDAEGTSSGEVTGWSVAFREDRADGAHTAAPVLARRDTESGEIVVVGVGDVVTPEEGGIFTLPWGVGTGSNAIDISQANTQWLMGLYQGGPNGDNAGAVVPFAGGSEYPMFGWNTAELAPEPDDVVVPGHASFDSPDNREYQFNFTVTWAAGDDLDGDGCSDSYEEKNGMNKNDAADALLDPDGDGLPSLSECTKDKGNPVSPFITKANVADTDVDGLNDGVETGTGVWVSATNTGTDPLKADTDKDKLLDGAETNSGVFVNATNAGTNPFNPDTDGDGAKDGLEISAGTNPIDANSVATNIIGNGSFKITHVYTEGDPQLSDAQGVEDVFADPGAAQIIEVKSPYIHFHDNVAPPWFQDESLPYPLFDEVNGGDGFGDREDFAILVEGQIWIRNTGTATFVCNSDDGFQLFIDEELIGEAPNRGRSDSKMEAELTEGLHDIRFIHWERGGGAGVSLLVYRGTGGAPGSNADDYELLRAFEDTTDTDGDGIPDLVEELNGLDENNPADAALDKDGDGLSNLAEFQKGTNMSDDDTDNDGLKDGVETGTGIWVSAANTGTDPKKPDTDGDKASDGVETNTGTFVSKDNAGTNPLNRDTDGDGSPDGTEIRAGSNPFDPTDKPASDTLVFNGGSIKEILGPDDLHLDPSTVVIAVDSFGDEDREVNGVTFRTDKPDAGVVVNGDVTVTTTATNSIDGWAAAPGFVGGQGDSADNLAQVMSDIRWEGAPNPVNIEIAGLAPGAGYEVQILVNEGGNRNRHWDIGVGVDPNIELVVDNFTSEGEAALPDDPNSGGVWSSDNSFAYTAEFTADGDGIINLVMQQEIDGPGGTPSKGSDNNPILQAVIVHRAGPSVPFQITDITVSAEQVVLSWNSLPGRDYAVEFTTDLSNPTWIEIDDGVASEGATTSFTDDDPARVGVPEGYYRVRR